MSDASSERVSLRVLLYCDADLNLIDGSSVWIASVAQVLALIPGLSVTVLLKRTLARQLLVEPLLHLPNVQLFDPFRGGQPRIAAIVGNGPRLQPDQAARIIATLDEERPFHRVLVRGLRLCTSVAAERSLKGRVWSYITDFTEEDREAVSTIATESACLLCQTEPLRQRIEQLAPGVRDKSILLPPMIPDRSGPGPDFTRRGRRLVYVGKLAPLWRTEEMVELVPELHNRFSDFELHVAGDKFHNFPPSPGFPERMESLLSGTPQVTWHRALGRESVQDLIENCDIGYSWRHPDLDTSVELSTKLLEYGLHGKPVLLNRVPMHEELLGSDYPLYCNSRSEVLTAVTRALSDDSVYRLAAERMWQASQRFTFSRAAANLAPHLTASNSTLDAAPLQGTADRLSVATRPLRVGFAGHDLKFALGIMARLKSEAGIEVRADAWAGHRTHDEEQSRALAQWADVVVAEWCLGNAVWYSHNLPANKGLVIRLHRVELETEYPKQVNAERVSSVIAVSPRFAERIRTAYPSIGDRVVHIPNAVDCGRFDLRKLGGSEFRLGLLGYVPTRKRLDLALDIFERLRRYDRRYVLYVKGRLPTELSWVWKKDTERRYFLEQAARINGSPWRDSVVFEPHADDVDVWFRKIGFLLSPSDDESFHMSVAEGLASGSVPVIRARDEVADLYPAEFVYRTAPEAVGLVRRFTENPSLADMAALKGHVRSRFDSSLVHSQWVRLLREAVGLG